MFIILDNATARDDAGTERSYQLREKTMLRDLALDLVKGVKRDEIEKLLASKYAERYKEDGPNLIYVDGGVGLLFRDDKLDGIVFMSNEPPSDPVR